MTADGLRALRAAVGIAVVGLGGYLLFDQFFAWNAGPQAEIITGLKRSERGWAPDGPLGLPLQAERILYQRIVVQLLGPDEALAGASLDFEGKLAEIEISAIGDERIPFQRIDHEWVATQGRAPRLTAVVAALDRRRRALESGDEETLRALTRRASALAEALPVLALRKRSYSVRAWYIRLERDSAEVTEDYRLQGETPDRPVDEKGSRRLTLVREGEEFIFSPGLM